MSESFLNDDILYFKNLIQDGRDLHTQPKPPKNAAEAGASYAENSCDASSALFTRQQAYHTNQVYDSIRDLLMEDYAIWNQHKYLYHVKKYQAYLSTLEHTEPAFRQEYLQRFSREFKRAQDLGELDPAWFSPEEKERLLFIMKEPNRFYRTYYEVSAGRSGLFHKLKNKLKKILK
ncbi:hypothetical protein ACTQ50_05130 [Blautia sp. Sow4_E7]|uniref:hypothetical protein n=1 Tax=Blautia sp. Sow4_E7 TaxID=3438749 RepID=UPI003F938974